MKNKLLTIIMFGMVGLSCSSPLSDTNVTDPSLLEPELVISKSIDALGARTVQYTADILDKNSNLVTLQNGNVKVDGFAMNLRAYVFGGEEYDLLGESEVKFVLDTTFTFALTLSDGSQYYGTVKSQANDLFEFDTPSTQSHTQNMVITWMDTDPNAAMRIEMTSKFHTDTSNGTGFQTIQLPNPTTGSFTINSSYFNGPQGTIYEVDLVLVSEIRGNIDSHFRSGSSTVSDLEIARNVTIN